VLATILVSSIVIAEPINSEFRRRPEGSVPPDAERLRRLWRRFHLVRAALAVAGAWDVVVVGQAGGLESHPGELVDVGFQRRAVLESDADGDGECVHEAAHGRAWLGHGEEHFTEIAVFVA